MDHLGCPVQYMYDFDSLKRSGSYIYSFRDHFDQTLQIVCF